MRRPRAAALTADMIEFSKLTRRRGCRAVLDDISFNAPPGEITALVGPNGAGKTTLIRVLTDLERATAGAALIGGRRYRDLPRPLMAVGTVLGGSGALRSRRAVDHLRWVALTHDLPRSRVDEVLDQVGLLPESRRRVGEFSLGMNQRLGIATALLGKPEILVLDEPTNGLDPSGIRWLRELLRMHAAEGGTVLISSHLLRELEDLAHSVALIDQGRLLLNEDTGTVLDRFDDLESAYLAMAGHHGRRDPA